jgi:hypothetical protein
MTPGPRRGTDFEPDELAPADEARPSGAAEPGVLQERTNPPD